MRCEALKMNSLANEEAMSGRTLTEANEYSVRRELQYGLEPQWRGYAASPTKVPGAFNYAILPQANADRSIQNPAWRKGFSQFLEEFSCSAAMAERRRLALEIHDTLIQQ